MRLETTTASEDGSNKITLEVTDRFLEEIRRIRKLTGFNIPTQFSRGYTLLKIVLDTYEGGGTIYRETSSRVREEIKIPGYNAPEHKRDRTG